MYVQKCCVDYVQITTCSRECMDILCKEKYVNRYMYVNVLVGRRGLFKKVIFLYSFVVVRNVLFIYLA